MTGPRLAGLTVLATLLLAGNAHAALGPFDPGFGKGGKLTLPLGEGPQLGAMAADPNGGFVLAGSGNPAAGEYALVRIGETGKVDTSFGNWRPDRSRFFDPRVTFFPEAIAYRAGGGWVTAGSIDQGGMGVAAHQPDGKLDRSFGSGGMVQINAGAPGSAGAVMTLSDGRVLVGGERVGSASGDRFDVARLTSDGRLDPTWGSGGIAVISPPVGTICDEEVDQFGVQALLPSLNGSTLVVGTTADPRNGDPVPVLGRLNADGRQDLSFGTNGFSLPRPPGGSASVAGAVLRGNGGATIGLTVGNHCDEPASTAFGVMAMDPDGSLVQAYGSGGTAVASFPADVRAYGIANVGANRMAVVGGIGDWPPFIPREFAVARFTTKGRVDRAFGGGRTCSEIIGGEQDGSARAVVAQSGRRLLVGGETQSDSESLELIRYRGAFTPGGIECYWPESLGTGAVKSVRLRAIVGRRGRLRLLVRSSASRRFRRVCLGTANAGNVVARWDGRIAGRSLKPGSYSTVLESRDARGRLLGRSYPRWVYLPHRATGAKRSGAC